MRTRRSSAAPMLGGLRAGSAWPAAVRARKFDGVADEPLLGRVFLDGVLGELAFLGSAPPANHLDRERVWWGGLGCNCLLSGRRSGCRIRLRATRSSCRSASR